MAYLHVSCCMYMLLFMIFIPHAIRFFSAPIQRSSHYSPPLPLIPKKIIFCFFCVCIIISTCYGTWTCILLHIHVIIHVCHMSCHVKFCTCHTTLSFSRPTHVTYAISTCYTKTSVTMLFSMLLYAYPCVCCHMKVIFHVFHTPGNEFFFQTKKRSSHHSPRLPPIPKNLFFGFFMFPS